jgi:antitoxin VapB
MSKAKAVQRKQNSVSFMPHSETSSATAKLFQNGRSQAVRLPKEFRFVGTEIGVGRVGNAVLLYPLNDPWAVFFAGANELSQPDLEPLIRDQKQTKRAFEE